MKPRTILFFDHTARLGGGEIALLNLVMALDKQRFTPLVVLGSNGKLADRLAQAGIETHIIPLDSKLAETRRKSVTPALLLQPSRLCKLVIYAWKLARFMQMRHVDALHTNSLKADIIGAVSARIARVPLVWHVRDRIAPDYLPAPAVHCFRWLCRHIPNCVIANSGATLATLGKAPRPHQHVVHDGMPPMALPPTPAHNPAPVIGLVGRISPWKGQHIFVEAARLVHKRHPAARYQIIGAPLFGEDAYEQDVRAQVKRLQLESSFEFTGFRDDIQKAIQELDILVHASITPEPFGQVVAEAMQLEKPVVATNGGGVPEIVEQHRTGILVPRGDAPQMASAIEWLLNNPHERARMGLAGRKRIVARFSIRQTARKVEQIYDELWATI